MTGARCRATDDKTRWQRVPRSSLLRVALLICTGVLLLLPATRTASAQAGASATSTPPSPTNQPSVATPSADPQTSAPAASLPSSGPAVPESPAAGTPPAAQVAPATTSAVVAVVRGVVRSGQTPLPGVTVTATQTLTGTRLVATTDRNGRYTLRISLPGRYVLRTDFVAFAPATREVVIALPTTSGGTSPPVASPPTGSPPTSSAEPSDQTLASASPLSPSSSPPEQTADFTVELLSRVRAREAAADQAETATTARSSTRRSTGLQSLGLTGDAAAIADASNAGSGGNAGMPSLPSAAADLGASEAVAVTGQQGQTSGLANFSEDELRDRLSDAIQQARRQGGAVGDMANAVVGMLGGLVGPGGGLGPPGGGFGGGRGGFGGGGRGGGGRGGFRNFDPTQIHGQVYFQGGNGALDATPFSVAGVPVKPDYSNNRYGISLAGSPRLPGLLKPSTKQFVFLNVTGQRNTNPQTLNGVVPTLAERSGDFSALVQTINGIPTQTPIYDPTTGQPFSGNIIQPNRIAPAASALLNFYPAPNIPATGARGYNYQTVTAAGQNSTSAALRFNRNFGQNAGFGPGGGFGGGGGRRGGQASNTVRQSINLNSSYAHSASDIQPLILVGGGSQASDGYGLTAGYSWARGRFSNNASVNWNRSHARITNYFTDTAFDPATASGIRIPSRGVLGPKATFYNALPNLTISNFASLTEQTPRDSINQTISLSDFIAWRHGKHNYRAGVDVRRVHADSLGGNNVAGTFIFSGYATEDPRQRDNNTSGGATAQAPSGAGFADFLLGLPQSTRIQGGLSKIYLRANVLDWYVQDDFRAKPSLTLSYGLRYEYFSPYIEKNDRLVNLDHNADFTAVVPVTPGQTSAFGNHFPRSLVNPDRTLFSPRFGVAWRPPAKSALLKNTVVRAGYGINYNTGQFATFAQSLSYQPPFAITQTNVLATATNPTGCDFSNLTLADGFGCSTQAIQNNYAVDRNYRLGRVQVWNLDIQRTLPLNIVLNLGYNGSSGDNLDILRAPNHTPTGTTTPSAQAFTFEDSVATSRFNALVVNARKRMQKGVSLQATYQYGHAIDNASSIGGQGGNTVVQNDARLDLEESNSSFDVRHRLTGNWVYELPFGPNRSFFTSGDRTSRLFDGFSLSGDFTFATGSYYTPQYSANAAQIASGGNYTLRPDRVFSQSIPGSGTLRSWFNPAAFAAPANGYGTASRNSIRGPGTLGIDASLSRTVSLGDTRSFEARVTGQNVFNTVQYSGIDTTVNSPTFGQVTGAAGARRLLFVARYRF